MPRKKKVTPESTTYYFVRLPKGAKSQRHTKEAKADQLNTTIDKITFADVSYCDYIEEHKEYAPNSGDTVVFDSLYSFADDNKDNKATDLFYNLYRKNVSLSFIAEPYFNTDVYKWVSPKMTLDAQRFLILNQLDVAIPHIAKVYTDRIQAQQAGIQARKEKGLKVGTPKDTKLTTAKSKEMKPKIKRMSKHFNGTMKDTDLIEALGISRNTFYKYKAELKAEQKKS